MYYWLDCSGSLTYLFICPFWRFKVSINSREDLDFEISFYERLINKNPNFVNALIALGDAYTRRGRYRDGLKIDQRLLELRPRDSSIYYNLACSYSLLKMADSCLQAIRRAMHLGYRDFAFMEKDPDLQFIRKDPRYKKLLSEYSKRTV